MADAWGDSFGVAWGISWQIGTPVQPEAPQGGAGHPVYYQGKRRKRTLEEQPEKHLRWIFDRAIEEYYAEIIAADVPKSVKKEAAALVRPFADKEVQGIPRPAVIDWTALQRDADAVGTILQIWNEELLARQIEDDDEVILLMTH